MRREIRLEAFLANLPLFRGLGADALARLTAGARRVRLARGEGRLANLIGPGRTFGEPVMYLEKPYHVSAAANRDSLVVQVAKSAVLAEIDRNPKFARRIVVDLARRVETMVRELETYALGSAAQRLVTHLLRDVPPGASGRHELTLPVAKRALASRLNLSAEHFSRILGEFSARGLIEVRGRTIGIPDLARLRAWRSGRSRKPS